MPTEIVMLKGGVSEAVERLDVENGARVGVVGGRWRGSVKRLMMKKFSTVYEIEDKAFSDTSAVVSVGGEAAARKAASIAKKFGCPLHIIMTTPAMPPLGAKPKQVLDVGEVISECERDAATEAFAQMAFTPFLLAERLTADLINDTFSPPIVAKKAYEVINNAFDRLENVCGAAQRALIVAEANLGLFALLSSLKESEELTRALGKFEGFGDDCAHEKEFLFALVATRFIMSRLCDEEGAFVPPPYANGRLKRAAIATKSDEKALSARFSQDRVDFKRVRPRIFEFANEISDVLGRTDNLNLRALRLLRRIRFDCGAALPRLLSVEKIANALGLLPEFLSDYGLLTALRDRGDLDLLLA